jgi:hypothetical protein
MRRVALALTAAAVVAIAGGITYAVADIGDGGVINGRYKSQNGQLRVIDPATDSCHPSETAISWSQTGTQGPNVGLYWSGGSCGAGFFTSTVFTSDGQDHAWNYMFVGVGGSSTLTLRSAERVRLPGRTVVRPAAGGRKGR